MSVSYLFSALHWRLPHEAVVIDPEAAMGERILPATLTPSPAKENSPLATTGGGASVRLGALASAQFSPAWHSEHETLTTVLF